MIVTKARVFLWKLLAKSLYPAYLRMVYKMDIGENVVISYKAILDKSINPDRKSTRLNSSHNA